MSYLVSNLSVLEQKGNQFIEKIQNIDMDGKPSSCLVESIDTKDGNKAILVTKEEKVYRLNSAYRPLAEAEFWVKQFTFQVNNGIFMIFGLGNGIFVREILKHLDTGSKLLIYEPSPSIFLHVMECYDMQDILTDPRVILGVNHINQYEFKKIFNAMGSPVNLHSLVHTYHPQYDVVFQYEYKNFLQMISDWMVVNVVNKNTGKVYGKKLAENPISNLQHINSYNLLDEWIDKIPKGVPAIIVSAGPSLYNNIELLREAKGKAVIFCVDTALKHMIVKGIEPDFVVTLDMSKSVAHFFQEDFRHIPLFCKDVSNPKVLDIHQGRKILYYNGDFYKKMFHSLGSEQSFYHVGGSVSTAAFSICVGLKFERIIFIGQDLCYDGKFTHAGNRIISVNGTSDVACMEVEDIYGGKVKARYDWYIFLLWFRDAIKECSHIEVIDATEGGAKIEGSHIMTFREAIDRYCQVEFSVAEELKKMPTTINQDNRAKVHEFLTECSEEFSVMIKKSAEAELLCSQIIYELKRNVLSENKILSMQKKLQASNNVLEELNIYPLVNDAIADISYDELQDIYHYTDDVIANNIKTFLKAKKIYEGLGLAAKELEIQYNEVVNKIMEEE